MGAFDFTKSFGWVSSHVVGFFVMLMAQEQQVLRCAPLFIRLRRVVALASRLSRMDMAQLRDVNALLTQDPVIAAREGAFVLGQDREVSERFFSDR